MFMRSKLLDSMLCLGLLSLDIEISRDQESTRKWIHIRNQTDMVKILTILALVDFSCNNFSGPIPKEMGEFKSLYFLNLSSIFFIGKIPLSFANMHQLKSLDLSQNKLSRQIPPQLAKLTFLEFLNLSNNQLVKYSDFNISESLVYRKQDCHHSPPPQSNGSHSNSGREIGRDLIGVEIGYMFGLGVVIIYLSGNK
ncbi:unnamed protein product [Malus baccata var. baccata]